MILERGSRIDREPPPGLDLALLSTVEDFAAFSRIVNEHLFCDAPEASPVFAGLLRSIASDRAFGYLARAEGEPVSAAYAYLDEEGIGGVYFVATATGARGRGFGSASVSAVLRELERRGAVACILHATELGKPVYEALGFVDACALPIFWLLDRGASAR